MKVKTHLHILLKLAFGVSSCIKWHIVFLKLFLYAYYILLPVYHQRTYQINDLQTTRLKVWCGCGHAGCYGAPTQLLVAVSRPVKAHVPGRFTEQETHSRGCLLSEGKPQGMWSSLLNSSVTSPSKVWNQALQT